MKNIRMLSCKVLLISIICSNASLFAQNEKPSRKIPVIENKSNGNNDYYVIFLSGNGGRRNLVKAVTRHLNSKNVSVLVINMEKYLWSEKKPVQIACDLENLIDRYNNKWGKKKVVFIGYSMGVEILPFAVDCMDDMYLNEINDMVLMDLRQKATFEVKLRDYFLEDNAGTDIYPELLKLKTKKAYVICGNNKFSICHKDLEGVIDHDFLDGGYHFGGDYNTLTKLISKRLNLECFSQTDSLIRNESVSSDIRMSYNSSIIYPGIRLGIDFPLYTVNVSKTLNSTAIKSFVRERFITANSGWYHHPDFHDNLYFSAEWTMRRTGNKGFFTEFSPGVGYSRTFLGGTTYREKDNGEITIVKRAGYNYALLIAGAGFGFDFSKLKGKPLSVYYKFDMLTMFPYNGTVYFRPAMELGLIYRPENFINILVKKRIVKK